MLDFLQEWLDFMLHFMLLFIGVPADFLWTFGEKSAGAGVVQAGVGGVVGAWAKG